MVKKKKTVKIIKLKEKIGDPPVKKGKGSNGNLTEAGYFKRHPDKAKEAGKMSKPFQKYKYNVIKALGLHARNDEKELKELMTLPKKQFEEIIRLLILIDVDDLEKVADKKKGVPAILKLYARGMMKDIAKGETKNAKEIIDRVFGKADQYIDADVKGLMANTDISKISKKDAKDVYLALMNGITNKADE